MIETPPLDISDVPDRRLVRATLWLACVLLVVVGLGICVLFNRTRVSRVVVPKFEIGGKVVVQVTGPDGKPLEGAMVTPTGLRSEQSPGSGFSWMEKEHGPLATVLTDAHGMAEILYPKWTMLNSAMLTSGIGVAVEHPVFVSQRHVECPLGSSARQVQLCEGGRVRLRVIRTDQSDPVTDFLANISGELYRKEWTLDGDARVSPVLSLGERFCRVVHFDNEHGTQFSELIRIHSAAGKTEEIEVRLQPGLKVRGRLSGSVPRPVSNGFVIAVVADETTDGDFEKCLSWQDWVAITEQGDFEFAALPPASEVRLLAFCDGFVSGQPVPADLPGHMHRSLAWSSMPQFFKVHGSELVAEVAMEPAASARFQVVDAHGQPLEGVEVGVSPSARYSTGSTLFGLSGRPGEDYGKTFANYGEVLRGSKFWQYDSPPHPDYLRPQFSAKSNAAGEVLIKNIPARGKQRVSVFHDKFVVQGQSRPPYWAEISIETKRGLTESMTISMQPKPELTPEMLLPPTPSLFDQIKEWLRKRLP